MVVVIFFIAHWYLSLFTQSFFHHRYASHEAFTMKKPWERVFYVLSYIMQGSSYLSPRVYGVMHRLHHAYTDTEKDPHSPVYDPSLMAMMWRTNTVYSKFYDGPMEVEPRFLTNLPDWPLMDKLGHSRISRLAWFGGYIAFYVFFATSPWLFLLLPIHAFMGPVHGAIINWFAHKYGYTNFNLKNTSRNLFPVDLIMWGEAYHNNHHRYSSRVNFGIRWHEIDPLYPIIVLFNKLGIIKIRPVPAG
jgi:stearoyl-CoA desaturase (Delta-9 desaturase)